MKQDSRQVFWRFTIRYNVILLGGLYFALLAVMIAGVKGRIEGEMVHGLIAFFFLILIVAFVSWIVCVIQTWRRTEFDVKFRALAMAYLFGAPVILFSLWPIILRLTYQYLS